MKAVVLAAGLGERLRPFTDTRPKPLIPILDRPLLDYTLESLRSAGVDEVLVVGSYRIEDLLRYLEAQRWLGFRLVRQPKPRGTGDALKHVDGMTGDSFVLVYGDVLVSSSAIKRLISTHEREGADATLLGVKVDRPWEYGVLLTDNGRLRGVVEKPPKEAAVSNIINGGVYIFSEEIFNALDRIGLSERGELELTDAINVMVDGGAKVCVVEAKEDEWYELGKPWDILRITRALMTRLRGGVQGEVEEGVKMYGTVYVAPGARVRSGSYIIGPAYIGEDAVVGPNCYIRGYTVVGRRAVIGNAVEVKASVMMAGSHAGHLSYIGDSVVGEEVNLGAGTITANLRFDDKPVKVTIKGERVSSGMRKLGAFIGDHVKTGINVSIMPGVKIGAYSWIYPGVVVYHDIPPYSIVTPEGEGLVIRERRAINEKGQGSERRH